MYCLSIWRPLPSQWTIRVITLMPLPSRLLCLASSTIKFDLGRTGKCPEWCDVQLLYSDAGVAGPENQPSDSSDLLLPGHGLGSSWDHHLSILCTAPAICLILREIQFLARGDDWEETNYGRVTALEVGCRENIICKNISSGRLPRKCAAESAHLLLLWVLSLLYSNGEEGERDYRLLQILLEVKLDWIIYEVGPATQELGPNQWRRISHHWAHPHHHLHHHRRVWCYNWLNGQTALTSIWYALIGWSLETIV